MAKVLQTVDTLIRRTTIFGIWKLKWDKPVTAAEFMIPKIAILL